MTAPRYALMTNFNRLTRAQLDELLDEVQARPPFDGYRVVITGIPDPTNFDRVHALNHAHNAWRETTFRAADAGKAKPARPAPTRTQGGPQSITARQSSAQALAIFAAIPACPVWGADPCTCALCTPQKATSP